MASNRLDAATLSAYRRCRTFQHSFPTNSDDIDVVYYPDAPVWRFGIELVCQGCGTVRKDKVDAYGEVRSRQYVYPPGYQYPENELPTKAEFRLSFVEARTKRSRRHG